MADVLKVLLGQRSMWAAALAAVAVYLGIDPGEPKIDAALQVVAGGGIAAIAAQLTYWFKTPKATLVKLLAGATPIAYAVAQALGMTTQESAQMAEVIGGIAGALVMWSGLQPNPIQPSNPKLQNRSG